MIYTDLMMAARARFAILLCLAPIALTAAGCGGGGGAGKASSPLDEGLSYLPKNAPLVISLDTDLNGPHYKDLDTLLSKFPLAGQLKQTIVQRIERGSSLVDFNKDVKPLLGNELVIGATDTRSLQNDESDFVGAVQVKDKGKLQAIVKKAGAKAQGEKSGAKLYKGKNDSDTFAIKDDVVVVASTKLVLEKALERRDGDDHMSEDEFDKGTEGVPKTALARVYANLADILKQDPDSRDALRSKWVQSIKTLGATATAESGGVKLAFKLKTDGDLSPADVPLATGTQAPGVISQAGRLSFGLRGADQLLDFAQRTGQALDPAGFGQFETAKQQIESRLGVDLDSDVIQQLHGDTAVVVGVDGQFGVRAELKDPAALRRTLKKTERVLPSLAGSIGGPGAKIENPRGGRGLYEFSAPGGRKLAFGVVKDAFVIARDQDEADSLASESAEAVPDAKGAFVFQGDAQSVARQAISGLAAPGLNLGGSLFTSPLGQLTGSIDSEADGLSGSFELGVK